MTEQEETLRKAISYCIEFYDNKEATNRIMQFIKDDRALQLLQTDVSGRSEQLCGNLDENYNCKNMCLTRCIDGNKFYK